MYSHASYYPKCMEMDMQNYDIAEMADKVRDPNSGVTTYLGEKTLEWASGNFYGFTVDYTKLGTNIIQNFYFSTASMELRYVTVEAQKLVLDFKITEKSFYDSDFAGLRCNESV